MAYIIIVIILAFGAMISLARYNQPPWYVYVLIVLVAAGLIAAGWNQTKKKNNGTGTNP